MRKTIMSKRSFFRFFFILLLNALCISAHTAPSYFTITPSSTNIRVGVNYTAQVTFTVQNTFGYSLTISSVQTTLKNSNITTTTTQDNCTNQTLANRASCTATITLRGVRSGTDKLNLQVRDRVFGYGSQMAKPIIISLPTNYTALSISKPTLALSTQGSQVSISASITTPLPKISFSRYGIQFNAGGWPLQTDDGSWGFFAPGFNDVTFAKEGQLVFVDDGSPGTNAQGNPVSAEGCNPLTNTNLNGKIAVIYRNNCSFSTKLKNAQDMGAIAAIVINRDNSVIDMAGGQAGSSVTIPAIFLSSDDGETLKARMGSGITNFLIEHKSRGLARKLMVRNIGNYTAQNVTYTARNLPSGTTVTPSSCGFMAPGDVCELSITPGSIPTALPYDLSPTPVNLRVQGSNTNLVNSEISILTYGSLFQSGLVFSIDDTTTNTASINAKIVALENAANNTPWTSSPGLFDTSTINGAQNTVTIVTNSICSDDPENCAAYQCKFNYTEGGYNDWYLPARFEFNGIETESIALSLPELYTNCSAGSACFSLGNSVGYWSSTEESYSTPADLARDAAQMRFSTVSSFWSGPKVSSTDKYIRCVRSTS